MKRFLLLFLLVGPVAYGQALRDINFSYHYSPLELFTFDMKPVRQPSGWQVYYTLQIRDTSATAADYSIQWETRTSLGEKEGKAFQYDSAGRDSKGHALSGVVAPPSLAVPQVLVAKVVHTVLKRAWYFFRVLDPKYPVNGSLYAGNTPVLPPYAYVARPYTFSGATAQTISFYRDDFPASAPAFSETLGRVKSRLQVDSIFSVPTGQTITFTQRGLYLVQQDTSSAEGYTFRIAEDYPRYAKIQNLADPLIYVCTQAEFDRIKQAKGDKKAFDKVILGITGDAERAKGFMRSYFRKVELANQYFSSYKEGWKTDRGMIYIVFGQPDEVFKFSDREVWYYSNSMYKTSFSFSKSPTLFDPENYVLIREKKYRNTWYEVIDLWRNARM
ncbi:GWxTD domain-containing protein [Fulvivirgaceae bacterium PWU5]|uniref:GWxTD domain-containing protein n=1 Tax=Dawidia cretensis TaxID=2782350 RepID=A0AAP2E2P2_9BACT|nr:GWxTD domain-containing protein [Dawidia cretensis]MBT1710434.1 GWxTD domain-containing protein [Dawidia cretensis]